MLSMGHNVAEVLIHSTGIDSNYSGMQDDCSCESDTWTRKPVTLPKLRVQCESTSSSVTDVEEEVVLSPLSQFFCNISSPPDIYAIKQLEGWVKLEELVQPMQAMADLHDRFRRRLMFSNGMWKGEVLQDFDVRSLMREVTLQGPDAQQAFDEYMGHLMTNEPLGSGGLPPWDVLCIHYACNPCRTDVLMRASHIIGDGQLFMKLIKQIMDPADEAAEADYAATFLGAQPARSCSSSSAGGSSTSRSTQCSRSPLSQPGDSSGGGGGVCGNNATGECCSSGGDACSYDARHQVEADVDCAAIKHQPHKEEGQQGQHQQDERRAERGRQGFWRGLHWLRLLWRLITMCWNGYTALLYTAILPFWFSDAVTVVKAAPEECTGQRQWSCRTVSLPEFHATAKQLGHSVNTLAVACLAGGVRRYVQQHGQQPAQRVRLCSMVDTRSMPGLLTGMSGNSNNFSFIGVPLFTGSCCQLQRVERVGRALAWIRHSLAVPLAMRMPRILQLMFPDPAWSSWAILRCLPQKTTIGFSNMRGPAGRWLLSGHPVVRIHNGVQPNAFGCFISLFSYGDTLTFTHTCYASKSRQPELLLECLLDEYQAIKASAKADTNSCTKSPIAGALKIKAA